MRIAVIGAGAVGTRAARQLAATDAVDEVVVRDVESRQARQLRDAMGDQVVVETAPFDAPVD
ncbi:MAG TPA: NAD-binding protein, partial [Acidimicrobiales bacterium]|nr:NAD-binding protein [Acidimicrobiales bacterium]